MKTNSVWRTIIQILSIIVSALAGYCADGVINP